MDIAMNYFSKDELKCKCCDQYLFDTFTLARLNELRELLGYPLIVTSGYRCYEYNKKNGYTQTHSSGQAVDIAIRGAKAYRLIQEATKLGFTGIGINQKGNHRFIHLDDLGAAINRPRPWIWSY